MLGRMLSPDSYVQEPGMTQSFNRYTYAMNNPLVYTDPDGQWWFLIPHISFGKGGLSIGLEVGVGIPGVLSASVTGGYNFKGGSGYWSVQGSAVGLYAGYGSSGAFAGYGYRYAGFSAGIGYGSSGWNAGISYGGTANNFNGALGFGWSEKGGFDWSVNAGYTYKIEKAKRTMVVEYNLEGAPLEALKQRDGYDCLICATEYMEQMPGAQGRGYNDILSQFGDSYDPISGTNTQGGLEKLYGKGNVDSNVTGNPSAIGREMKKGNPTILALNKNHAIIATKIEIWTKQMSNRAPSTYFKVRYMNPATGQFQYFNNYRWKDPTFTIKLNR